MENDPSAMALAVNLVLEGDYQLYGIIGLSLQVSLLATLIATGIGLPLAAWLAIARFPGRGAAVTILNAMLGLPPVVVGLFVYLSLSRAGPLGELGLLFTPAAMVIAQTILITPIVAAIGLRSLEDFNTEYAEQLRALGLSRRERAWTLLAEARFSLATAVLAGFGRAVAEVGAVMIVGGNIAGVTRVMTTAIALETSKGDLALALALGLVLIAIALSVNAAASLVREIGRRSAGEITIRGEA
ncbi:MAG: ABC transporter permease [Alphaproteobacteria bacterium]|nr:ABC transporter permease [Alphaproteobacteria bacterium]MBO6861972.1 ABC transporter permease [Alphaproteobacteria bacterium]